MLVRCLRRLAPLLLLVPLLATAGCRDTRRRGSDSGPNPFADAGGCGEQTMCGLGCADLASDPTNCGECGLACPAGLACLGGSCGECTPSCFGAECGDDGCGGTCGVCESGFCVEGSCEAECTPQCVERECGNDGCGGSCGFCGDSECVDGFCSSTCEPFCEGSCGDDGCGGSCGTCSAGTCVEGECSVPSGGEGESCASPIVLSGVGSTAFTLTGRSLDHSNDCASSPDSDVVFAVTPTTSGFATFETTGEFDLALTVFGTSTCSTSIGCDDDGGVDSNPSLSISVLAFTTYYIVVSPYSGGTGSGTFSYSLSAE